MDKGRIVLKLVLDQIGMGDLQLDLFSDRLLLQKKIYLLQITGMDLGYRYNWHIKGPYGPPLTKDAFTLKEELQSDYDDYKEYTLTKEAKQQCEKALSVWALPENVTTNEPEWIELLASLHFLNDIAYWPNKKRTKDEVVRKLLDEKPHFLGKTELIDKAWDRLRKFDLFKQKEISN